MRRVLVLNHFAVPRGQPGGTRHVELFDRLAGWSYLIVASRLNLTTGRAQAPEPGFCPVRVLPYRGNGVSRILNWMSYAVTATVAALRQPRPDVVYASSPHLLAGVAGWMLARSRRSRFVLEIRDLWPQVLLDMGQLSESSAVYRCLLTVERFLYRSADAIVVMATGSVDHLRRLDVPAAKISYIPNGADPADFVPTAPRAELRERYGFDRLTAVYAGAHGPANGLHLLLDAAAQVPEVDVVLIGDGVEKPALRRSAAQRDLTNVRFLDPVPKTEMPDVLAAADAGLHVLADVAVFRGGVSPNKVFDYMAAGLPVVTNSPGVVGDLVENAGCGWAVEPGSLLDALRDLSQTTDDERGTRGGCGARWLGDHQSRAIMAARLREQLEDRGDRPGR